MLNDTNIAMNSVTIYHAIKILNDSVSFENTAVSALFKVIMPCSKAVELSETLDYFSINESLNAITVLSIINAIFAYSDVTHNYSIIPVYDNAMNIIEFRLGVSELET